MPNPDADKVQRSREMILERYVGAYDRGDWDEISEILKQALFDPDLDKLLNEVDATLYTEAGLPALKESVEMIRTLLHQHLPSAFAFEPPAEEPITVDQVAQRIEGDRLKGKRISAQDIVVNRELTKSKVDLPRSVTPDSLRDLAHQLSVKASESYWEMFRRAALALRMARETQRVSLAAARRQRSKGPTGTRTEHTHQNEK
jgi:hypothetical protein